MGITASLHTRPCSAVVGLTGAQFLKCSIDGLNLSLLCVCVCVRTVCAFTVSLEVVVGKRSASVFHQTLPKVSG